MHYTFVKFLYISSKKLYINITILIKYNDTNWALLDITGSQYDVSWESL